MRLSTRPVSQKVPLVSLGPAENGSIGLRVDEEVSDGLGAGFASLHHVWPFVYFFKSAIGRVSLHSLKVK
jgi:hypothetical protein